jgi:hypothetical protein
VSAFAVPNSDHSESKAGIACADCWDDFLLHSIDLRFPIQQSVPNSDQQTKKPTFDLHFAVGSSEHRERDRDSLAQTGIVMTDKQTSVDYEHAYLDRPEPLLGLPSSPRTTSHIGFENMRQIRSSVRNVIGFPASTFCQYRTEYPCESMSSWLSPASSRKRLIRAPKPLKNWDSSRMIPFSKLHALKTTRPI